MKKWSLIPLTGFVLSIILISCSPSSDRLTELMVFPLDNLKGIIDSSIVEIDDDISNDGNGSLRIIADEPATVKLYETGDIDIENARLIYRAKIRTENIDGQVYLEMWCVFPGKGEFFSRDLQSPLKGTHDWSVKETYFFLNKGENPGNVKLNLVVNGRGTVWIDDIHLLEGPLE